MAVKVDFKGIKATTDRQARRRAQYAVGNQMLIDMNNHVPLDSSTLRQTGSVGKQGEELTWETKYAKAQFYGTNGKAVFRNYTTPGTGSRWDLKASGMYMNDWEQVYLRGLGL